MPAILHAVNAHWVTLSWQNQSATLGAYREADAQLGRSRESLTRIGEALSVAREMQSSPSSFAMASGDVKLRPRYNVKYQMYNRQ